MSQSSFHPSINRDAAEIRLLELLPGQRHDKISCNLFVVSLSEAPGYEALSYVWGNKNDTFDMLLCGKKFPALKTLQVCLTELRHHNRSRIMWIDSFCIDQDNDAERNHQVKLMAQIYRNATKVIAWIGDPHNLTLKTARTLIACADSIYLSLTQTAMRSALVEELHSFFECSWWSRVWTLQEMLLAENLEFSWRGSAGVVILSWGDLIPLVGSFVTVNEKKITSRTPGGSQELVKLFMLDAIKRSHKIGIPRTFDDLIILAQSRRCTDPRDKVYGLLGVVADLPEMIIDYTLPMTKVYEQLVAESIRGNGNLDILMCRRSLLPTEGMASWATNWIEEENSETWLPSTAVLFIERADLYSTGLSAPAQAVYDGRRSLCCAGRLHDEIITVFDTLELTDLEDIFASIKKWSFMSENELHQNYIAGGTRDNAFWRSLCGDMVCAQNLSLGVDIVPRHSETKLSKIFGGRARMRRAGREVAQVFRCWWSTRVCAIEEVDTKYVSDQVVDFEVSVFFNCVGKSMFVTKRGYIGIGHSVVRPGDHVAILLGGQRPFIVRPVRPGETRTEYTYHGPCYVHGIMDGEAVEQLNLLPRPYPFLTLI